MMYLKIAFILLSAITVVYLDPMVKNANNYGPFTMSIDDYGDCKGPKSKNLTIMTTSLDKQLLIGIVNFTYLTDAKIEEIKLRVHNIKETKRTFLWNHKLTDPCKHYAFASMINQFLKANNCLVKKGNYTCVTNFGEAVSAFIGNSFFYGTYSYRTDITSKKGNIACFNTTITYTRKKID